jgi:hypothetical protein
LGRIRVRVEHALAGVKRCRIVKDVLRNTAEELSDAVMEAACGLHNLRVDKRYPRVLPSAVETGGRETCSALIPFADGGRMGVRLP